MIGDGLGVLRSSWILKDFGRVTEQRDRLKLRFKRMWEVKSSPRHLISAILRMLLSSFERKKTGASGIQNRKIAF
jgi:hypothetical protein